MVWLLEKVVACVCHFLASTEIRHLDLRPPIHKVPYFLEGK